jgi:hypothetical protein
MQKIYNMGPPALLPSKGRRTGDFFALKNPTALARFEPANLGTRGQHATSRPPKLLKETRVQLDKKHWYEHIPKSVETSQGGNVTILWNQHVQTDRTIPNKKPDIIIHDNEKGTRMLIDVAISGDINVIKIDAEKILKYKDLTIEIQCMWNVKTRVIPVIIGATGTISKSFRKYVRNKPGNHEVKELQKTATLGTAHILRNVLM